MAVRVRRAPASGTRIRIVHADVISTGRTHRKFGPAPVCCGDCWIACPSSYLTQMPCQSHVQATKKAPEGAFLLAGAPLNASGASDGRRTSDNAGPNGTSPDLPPPVPGHTHKREDRNTRGPAVRNTPAEAADSKPAGAAGSTREPAPHKPVPPARPARCRRSHAPTPSAARPALPVRLHLQSTAHCVESSSSPAA